MILAGLCDLLDGPVARRQGRVSNFGGFLDSILDRYADLILFLGLLVYYAQVNRFLYAILAGAAMAGSVMVSYARARAESLVPTSEIGFCERPERLVLMISARSSIACRVALWILAIGPNITVIHRILHTWKQTKHAAPASDSRTQRSSSSASSKMPLEVPAATPILRRSAAAGEAKHAQASGHRRLARHLRRTRSALAIAPRNQVLDRRLLESFPRPSPPPAGAASAPCPSPPAAEKRQGAFAFLLGMGFAFFLGPILIVLGVTLMFYKSLGPAALETLSHRSRRRLEHSR